MYGYILSTTVRRNEIIEVGYGYDSQDDARAAAIRRCLVLTQHLMFCPVYKVFSR
jgi:hypothetical protein